jgi:magnesium transporter
MINGFEIKNGRLQQINLFDIEPLQENILLNTLVWVDLENPTEAEREQVKTLFELTLPEEADLTDIEASARYYEEEQDGSLHLRTDFLLEENDEPARNVTVAFILYRGILFSLRKDDLPVFRLVRLRARQRPGSVRECKDVLLDIYATDAEYSADALEAVYRELEKVSAEVLRQHFTDDKAAQVLSVIAQKEDINGRIRRNLMDTRRALSFLMRGKLLNVEQFDEARQILRDIESLDGHTSFLFEKINFLMDATVGFININQNKIIKIFSVASVAFLPPTLIASIYGMNFDVMPELKQAWGYPVAITLMLLSIFAPIFYFRKRGWLK